MASSKKNVAIISIILICTLFFSACDGIQINANAQGSPDQEEGLDLGIEIEAGTGDEESAAPASNNPETNTYGPCHSWLGRYGELRGCYGLLWHTTASIASPLKIFMQEHFLIRRNHYDRTI